MQPLINASTILLKVGVRSFSIDLGECDFSNMTTVAIFQMRGTSTDGIDELK